MDHVVYLDVHAGEMEKLLNGSKTMIIRGAAGRKLPYGRVNEGDVLYFINNDASGVVKARAKVSEVIQTEKLGPDASSQLVADYMDDLDLTKKQFERWSGKRYLVLVRVENIEKIDAFFIDKSEYGNMDDWLPVEDINKVKK